jgi:hypothetical protein
MSVAVEAFRSANITPTSSSMAIQLKKDRHRQRQDNHCPNQDLDEPSSITLELKHMAQTHYYNRCCSEGQLGAAGELKPGELKPRLAHRKLGLSEAFY